jgi:hypothetical protein
VTPKVVALSFAFVPLSQEDAVLSIVPLVDGVRLTDLIGEFERARSFEPAGGYAGLVPSNFNFGPLDHYFMAASTELNPRNRHYLLGCQCGEVGCWPLEAQIIMTERQISWEDFKQPFRQERDYSSFGPFRFDLMQYSHAVNEMAAEFRSAEPSAAKE